MKHLLSTYYRDVTKSNFGYYRSITVEKPLFCGRAKIVRAATGAQLQQKLTFTTYLQSIAKKSRQEVFDCLVQSSSFSILVGS
jgi:hypothetical protein